MLKKDAINSLFSILEETIKPESELEYSNHFELLIAVILSAQSTDKMVNKATRELFKVANTPQKMIDLGLDGLSSYIQSIGLYKSKAKNIFNTCQILIEKFKGKIPSNRQDLLSLPGVGQKTASVVLNVAFQQPTIAVDTHVFRVSNRTGLVKTKTPEQTEEALYKVVPPKYLLNAHHYLILHGRYVCTARKPKCPTCNIRAYCQYKDKTLE